MIKLKMKNVLIHYGDNLNNAINLIEGSLEYNIRLDILLSSNFKPTMLELIDTHNLDVSYYENGLSLLSALGLIRLEHIESMVSVSNINVLN